MNAPLERHLELPGGRQARVWEKGHGPTLGYLGGLVGLVALYRIGVSA